LPRVKKFLAKFLLFAMGIARTDASK
jgi:hypothetical protein